MILNKADLEKKYWRSDNPHKGQMDFKTIVRPTRFFDQLSYIGTKGVGCFLLETAEGLVLIDCICPMEEHKKLIIDSITELGHELKELKAIILTHGHGDHYGCADWFRKETGCRIYMSSVDTEFARSDFDGPSGALEWIPDEYIEDGDVFELGGQKVYAFATPGHTPGCMSYIIPVTDCGEQHLTALWGGTGIPYKISAKAEYLRSCAYFAAITEKMGVDSAIATHAFIDQGLEKLEIIRNIVDGVSNPFVLGKAGYKKYENMFRDMCINALLAQAPQADSLLPPPPRKKPLAR